MALVNLCRRALMKLACWDQRDLLKPLIVRIARILTDDPKVVEADDIDRLFQYTFPQRGDSGLVIRHRGSPEIVGSRRNLDSDVFNWSVAPDAATDERHSCLLLLWGEGFSSEASQAALASVADAATDYVVVSVPTYPEHLFCPTLPNQFERVSRWKTRAGACGLTLVPGPREQFSELYPLVFRTSLAAETPVELPQCPRVVFGMPERASAFRWVTEDLAVALCATGVSAGFQSHEQAERVLTWAHYWPDHDVDVNRGDAEFFVSNFRFSPREQLTPWLYEVVERQNVKLPPSTFSAAALSDLGVDRSLIHVVPHAYSPEFCEDVEPLHLSTQKTFKILAVVNSHDPNRYGTDLLLAAAAKAFTSADDVCIVVKDYGADCERIKQSINSVGPNGPEFLYYANFMSKPELARFYKACDAFVAPFRGEGFGMKILDAAVIGLPLILPLYGGPTDYCDRDLVWPIAYDEVEVGDCLETRELTWNEKLTWCEPRVDDLARQMRAVYEQQAEAKRRAEALREKVIDEFTWAKAAEKLREALDL